MIKNLLNNIAEMITDDTFPRLLGVALFMLLLGICAGFAASEDLSKQQCNQMSITEALKYPYCRTYIEKEFERILEKNE